MEYMRTIPDKKFDLAIVDPPYGINQGGKNNKTRGNLAIAKDYKDFGDRCSPNQMYFNELLRISRNQIIFGANHFIDKIPYNSSCWIVWDKNNGTNDFADCELAWTSFKTSVRKFKYTWNGMLQENMKQKEKRIHPTQKPVALYIWLLTNYAKPGDLIFDSHVGSGSSLVACEKEGFDYVGCELDKDYYQQAKERIEIERRQPSLFSIDKVIGM